MIWKLLCSVQLLFALTAAPYSDCNSRDFMPAVQKKAWEIKTQDRVVRVHWIYNAANCVCHVSMAANAIHHPKLVTGFWSA